MVRKRLKKSTSKNIEVEVRPKMGRPKKYDDEFISKELEALVEWMKDDNNFWLKDFSIERGYPYAYLSVWANENESFSNSLKKAHDIQETKLVKGGLSGKFNNAMAIFVLKNVAGYRDVQAIDHTIKDPTNWFELMKRIDEGSKVNKEVKALSLQLISVGKAKT